MLYIQQLSPYSGVLYNECELSGMRLHVIDLTIGWQNRRDIRSTDATYCHNEMTQC